jgi:hypothetical protein
MIGRAGLFHATIQAVSTTYIYIYSEDIYSVLNFHNVANHTEFYLGYL